MSNNLNKIEAVAWSVIGKPLQIASEIVNSHEYTVRLSNTSNIPYDTQPTLKVIILVVGSDGLVKTSRIG